MMHKPKTLDDFPKFSVNAIRRGTTSAQGYTRFELEGTFDRIIIPETDPHWFWLLFDKNDCLCVTLQTLDAETRTATLTCDERDEPKVVGQTLAYLSPYWQAYHVWMVVDPDWGWQKTKFHGADAIAQNFDAGEISFVGNREVRVWTKVEPAEHGAGQIRYYPASDQTLPTNSEVRLVRGGWGHEHCDLCKSHIEAGEFGYCDPSGRWMCEKCYNRYVMQRDLAFVDER